MFLGWLKNILRGVAGRWEVLAEAGGDGLALDGGDDCGGDYFGGDNVGDDYVGGDLCLDGGVFLVAIMEITLTQLNTLVITFPRSWKKMATFDLKVLKEHRPPVIVWIQMFKC